MTKRKAACAGIALTSILAFAVSAPGLSQATGSSPPARYTMDAGTTSGFAGMSGGGGIGAALGMMRGGGGQVSHELTLRLGSHRAPSGPATADHFMPQGAGLGASVPLVSPERTKGDTYEGGIPQGQMPRGRLLLFWGCGEHAPAGQPLVIDFAKMAKGQLPPNLFASGVRLPGDWQIMTSNSTTYGEWPNGRDRKVLTGKSSLLGAHKVVSSYAPEIAFTLADDFMLGLQARTAAQASGAVGLSWTGLPRATGYYAWAMGAKGNGGNSADMVWWSSSSTRMFGGELAGWLSPAAVSKLISSGTVMPASQTACTIPAEVKQAGGEMLMTQLFAYGPQVDFSFPPRPRNARAGWQPDWITRVRFRSNTSLMAGMPQMSGREDTAGNTPDAPPAKPKCKGIKGIAMRAAGLCE